MMGQSYSGSYGFQILHLRERKAIKSPRKGVEGRKGGKRGRGLCLFPTQGLLRGTAGERSDGLGMGPRCHLSWQLPFPDTGEGAPMRGSELNIVSERVSQCTCVCVRVCVRGVYVHACMCIRD